jgi:hypothetical protein
MITLFTTFFLDGEFRISTDDDLLSPLVFQKANVKETHLTFMARDDLGTFNNATRRTADMERPKGELSAGDIKPIVTASYANAPTRLINKLIDKKMLRKQKEAGRKYLPSINNNYLLRGFVESLRKNQFIAFKE